MFRGNLGNILENEMFSIAEMSNMMIIFNMTLLIKYYHIDW